MRRALGFVVSLALVIAACGGDETDGGSTKTDPTKDPAKADGGTATNEPSEPVPTGPPAVAFVGRFETSDPKGPKAAWPGTRIIVRFEGTAASVKLEEDFDGDDEGPSEWDVIVDGEITKKIVTKVGEHDYDLATGLAQGIHVVEIYKRSEAQGGVTTFLGFDLAGGTMLAPPVRPSRRIEIIGDSAVAGFGVEGVGQGPDCPGSDWGARYQNFHKSVGQVLADTFKADLHGTVYSGKGFARNIWRPDKDTLPKIYELSNPLDTQHEYDLSSWKPDAIVIMAGGNDFAEGMPEDDGPASLEEFTDAYATLVDRLRGAYPEAQLVLAPSPSTSDDNPPGRETRTNIKRGIATIVSERSAKGDKRIHSIEPAPAKAAELEGCNGHGTPEFHTRVAGEIATLLRSKTGW